MPLDLFIQGTIIKSHLRLKEAFTHDWDGIPKNKNAAQTSHFQYAEQLISACDLPQGLLDQIPYQATQTFKYKVISDSFNTGAPLTNTSGLKIFTDGSKYTTTGLTGAGIVFQNDSGTVLQSYRHLGGGPTVFQAEATAIDIAANLALEYIQHNQTDRITIYSDSQATLLALKSSGTESLTVRNCVQSLNQLGNQALVLLRYEKAPVGHQGNELADQMAKKGANTPPSNNRPPPDLPLPPCQIKAAITKSLYTTWNNRWKSNKLSQSKLWFPELDPKQAKVLLTYKRAAFSRMVRYITGHVYLNKQNWLVSANDDMSSLCRLCNQAAERASHIIQDCEPIWRLRMDHFGSPFLPSIPYWSINQLHGFLSEPSIMMLERIN
jgi:ribonuclease HI